MPSAMENQETLKKDETGSLIAADKVQGTDIYSRDGENLGEVESVMIDKLSGKVAYAVVTFGGFLGIGTERRALPWNVLTYNVDLGGYVANATKAGGLMVMTQTIGFYLASAVASAYILFLFGTH